MVVTLQRLLLFMVCVSVTLCGASCAERQGVGPGEFAYDFSLRAANNPKLQVSLKALRGKVVVVNFWASWCTPCLDELPALERLSRRYPDKIAVVGVGIDDDHKALAAVAKRLGVTFPTVLDADGTLKQRYQVRGVPETFIVGPDGRLALFPDRRGEISVRLLGPRPWDSAYFVDALLNLTKNTP